MAIEKSVTKYENDYGISCEKGYIKINSVEIRGNEVRINVNVYVDKEARDSNKNSIQKSTYAVKFSDLIVTDFSENGIKTAAYNFLKTMKFYQGVDC